MTSAFGHSSTVNEEPGAPAAGENRFMHSLVTFSPFSSLALVSAYNAGRSNGSGEGLGGSESSALVQ